MERRVLFKGGLDVDFSIILHARVEQMIQHGFPPEVADVFRRGTRVLLDRDGLAARLSLVDAKARCSASANTGRVSGSRRQLLVPCRLDGKETPARRAVDRQGVLRRLRER